jgi:hypothetical protein
MLTEEHGDLLNAPADALVNTVNTVGTMGKGLALQFKQAYPGDFGAYEAACRRGEVHLGKMFTYETGRPDRPRFIINFPTKGGHASAESLTVATRKIGTGGAAPGQFEMFGLGHQWSPRWALPHSRTVKRGKLLKVIGCKRITLSRDGKPWQSIVWTTKATIARPSPIRRWRARLL